MLVSLGFCVHKSNDLVPRIRVTINDKSVDLNLDIAGDVDDQHSTQQTLFTKCESRPNNKITITLLNHLDGQFGFQVRSVLVDNNDLKYFGTLSTVCNPGFGRQTGSNCDYVHIKDGTYEIEFDYPIFDFVKKQGFGRLVKDHLKETTNV